MIRALIGIVAGGALAGVLGFAIARLFGYIAASNVEHDGFHFSIGCAIHGAISSANIGIFGWREELNETTDVLCFWR